MTTSNNIIGIAGSFGSGKDTLADYLVAHQNYFHVSTGDLVRKESIKRHNSVERNPYLQETATYLRKNFGGGVLVERALDAYAKQKAKHKGVVITGIRSLGEAKAIQKAGGRLVFVDAPIDLRYARIQARQRDNESKVSLEHFKMSEQKENSQSDSDADFNIFKIKELADVQLSNDTDVDSFYRSATAALKV